MKIEVCDKRVGGKENVFVIDMPQCPRVGEGFLFGEQILTVREVVWTPQAAEDARIIVR